jgi:beta-fructofuranosidase
MPRPSGGCRRQVREGSVPDHRPRFHLSAPSGWLNDPNGPIHRDGRHHVFFQRNPAAAVWSPAIHWGHAASEDLVRWTHLPDAFGPSPEGPDAGGCWSGCVVDDAGVPTAVYSGLGEPSPIGAANVCLARADAALVRWEKDPRNPVLTPPSGMRLAAFRDPFVRREDGAWSMLLGAGVDGDAAVLRFRSPDLLDWTYEGVVLRRPAALDAPVWTGRAWECPQLFPLGDRHVLLVSVWDERPPHTHYAVAFVGRDRDGRFEPERVERFDHGADCYAPAVSLDDRGRRLAFAWSWEARDEAAALEQGWAGVHTLPRELTLTADGRLGIAPVREVESLRGSRESVRDHPLGRLDLRTRSDCLDLAATIAPGSAARIRLLVRAAPGGEEQTAIVWEPGRLAVDRSRSSLDPRAAGGVHGGPLDLAGRDLELRVLVDRSIVEVFANGALALTERIYPAHAESTGVAVEAVGGQARLRTLDAWELRP